jgi:phosphotriesterase-related protein
MALTGGHYDGPMPIYTTLGPIAAEDLGPTNMHEHVFIDARTWLLPPREQPPENQIVAMENIGFLRWNPMAIEDNLIIDDPDLAIRELAPLKDAGASGLVDLTCIGLTPRIEDLAAVSRATGLHIMAGCGFYVHPTHPEWVETATVEELTDFLISELTNGIAPTDIRPALIGEIGTSDPITERERKVLVAAGRAGARTGSAVNVHLEPRGRRAVEVVEILTDEGMPADRVILSHMDENLDRDYHLAAARTGAILEYDTFGSEQYFAEGWKDPTDDERMQYVRMLVDEGFGAQLVLSSDVWVKTCLRHYGGMGYEHVQKRVVPALERTYGVAAAALEQMLVHTPRRLLDRP